MSSRNFQGTFGKSPAPFQIKVDPEFITLTKQKVSLTRIAEDVDQPEGSDGPSLRAALAVKDYWVNEYDWKLIQKQLNNEYDCEKFCKCFGSYVHQALTVYNDCGNAIPLILQGGHSSPLCAPRFPSIRRDPLTFHSRLARVIPRGQKHHQRVNKSVPRNGTSFPRGRALSSRVWFFARSYEAWV